ncbi:hypothetical protein [Mesorhizobium sp. M7A.F.Ca.MR.362.00.0.0]|uniref:hypothetical protein n=1 Tax=Mesorhizobium sp. M7A.F.Ca.MR.362.00.0.0 TaxID=2496779 RepID=UPI0019D4D402|nr:hypothetical protein [Mesorhizobium sp. M7A.F.Ca.MR.362.00.0.0]
MITATKANATRRKAPLGTGASGGADDSESSKSPMEIRAACSSLFMSATVKAFLPHHAANPAAEMFGDATGSSGIWEKQHLLLW